MKKLLITSLICSQIFFALLLLSAYTRPAEETKASATVNQVEGYYIFQQCKPVKEYEYLGSVKVGLTWNGQPEENFKSIIKRVKKEYPKADGIIFQDLDMKKVDAIVFK